MFSSKLLRTGPVASTLINCNSSRGAATLKDIRMRLNSVKNIQKITQSMKMVSAAKYNRAERDLAKSKGFSLAFPKAFRESSAAEEKYGHVPTLVIAVTSDRGLCGAVHSSVAKKIRAIMAAAEKPENIKIVCVGDKSRLMLANSFPNNILLSYKNVGKKPASFTDAKQVALDIVESGFKFEKGLVVYNQFKSVVSYLTTEKPFLGFEAIANSPDIYKFDSVDESVLRNYYDFSLASFLYYCMKENACSEQSSRMTAMDNATKNAGEMIGKLTLQFNRTRQAVITRELTEIVSGAAAL